MYYKEAKEIVNQLNSNTFDYGKWIIEYTKDQLDNGDCEVVTANNHFFYLDGRIYENNN